MTLRESNSLAHSSNNEIFRSDLLPVTTLYNPIESYSGHYPSEDTSSSPLYLRCCTHMEGDQYFPCLWKLHDQVTSFLVGHQRAS
ncbi:hypothetical protein E2C01_076448 [Portunus trituberculatus]|uniref:Uncharacterized protein n=1 Tax=Portunus trituberculatus TaxID=210409 RepID=A0A5B7IHP3_PORTR|nr:hypothetical protein [Portunus trituberculatus]